MMSVEVTVVPQCRAGLAPTSHRLAPTHHRKIGYQDDYDVTPAARVGPVPIDTATAAHRERHSSRSSAATYFYFSRARVIGAVATYGRRHGPVLAGDLIKCLGQGSPCDRTDCQFVNCEHLVWDLAGVQADARRTCATDRGFDQ